MQPSASPSPVFDLSRNEVMLQVVRMASDANQKRVLIMSESLIIPKRINGHAERVPIRLLSEDLRVGIRPIISKDFVGDGFPVPHTKRSLCWWNGRRNASPTMFDNQCLQY